MKWTSIHAHLWHSCEVIYQQYSQLGINGSWHGASLCRLCLTSRRWHACIHVYYSAVILPRQTRLKAFAPNGSTRFKAILDRLGLVARRSPNFYRGGGVRNLASIFDPSRLWRCFVSLYNEATYRKSVAYVAPNFAIVSSAQLWEVWATVSPPALKNGRVTFARSISQPCIVPLYWNLECSASLGPPRGGGLQMVKIHFT